MPSTTQFNPPIGMMRRVLPSERLTIQDSLSVEAVATVIAFLQPAAFYRPANEDAGRALNEVQWFVEQLSAMLSVEELNEQIERLGL